MKVLLIQPAPPRTEWPRGMFRSRWVPTGLACLGRALLRAGHRVRAFTLRHPTRAARLFR